MTSAETYKTVAEIAKKFQISPKTVYKMCRTEGPGRWPCGRVGTGPNARIRFSPEHEAAIDELVHGTGPAASTVDTAQLRRAGKRVLKARRQGLAA